MAFREGLLTGGNGYFSQWQASPDLSLTNLSKDFDMHTLDVRAAARALGGDISGRYGVICPGPGHSHQDRSLSIKFDPNAPDGFVVHSFAGDDPIACKDHVRGRLGLEAFKPNGDGKTAAHHFERMAKRASNGGAGRIVATYDYTDQDGTLLYQVLRYEPKDFRQRRPDGNGGWIYSRGDQTVLYRWPELAKYPEGTVFVCEGEKDADRVASLGLCATTISGGAKWTEECVAELAGRDILILEDVDAGAGNKRAVAAAAALHGHAKSVRMVRLPGLNGHAHSKDVSDWLDADPNRGAEELAAACFETPLWAPQRRGGLPFIDMSKWDREPIPERKWAIRDRVPLNQAGLFSGEGGTGKSIIELTKNIAHVAGKDWLGSLPEQGPAIYIGAEDDKDELHIRLAAIAKHYEVTFEELTAGGLHVLCLLGEDATLCAAGGKSGKVEVTDLYRQVFEAAGDIKPKNISIDTLSRAFGGNEIDRVQVYAFAMHMQALAMVAGGSVTVLSHPSLQGISSGSGISGSTAWHGAFRFRQYLKGVKPGDGEQPDNDLRQLEVKKNQYGPTCEAIALRYEGGLFLPLPGMSSLDQAAREAKAEEVFLDLLRSFTGQNRYVSDKTSPAYAPALFAKEAAAKTAGLTSGSLAAAMRRLFASGRIWNEPCGKPSRPQYRIALKV
jgi:RecA-family ATPase/5S rRNA maturation endonuclease (ribonuclease M5)